MSDNENTSDVEISDDYIQSLISKASSLLQKKDEFKKPEVVNDKPKQKRFLTDEAKERARERLKEARIKAQEVRIMKKELLNSELDEEKKVYNKIKDETPKTEKKSMRIRNEPPQKPPKQEIKEVVKEVKEVVKEQPKPIETSNVQSIPEKKQYFMPHYKYAKRFGFINPL